MRHYPNGKFFPVREDSARLGSYVVDFLDPNRKLESYKSELELNYEFWNFDKFDKYHDLKVSRQIVLFFIV